MTAMMLHGFWIKSRYVDGFCFGPPFRFRPELNYRKFENDA
jgi:hypothetical protein